MSLSWIPADIIITASVVGCVYWAIGSWCERGRR
jgi:hypothetical protein